MKKVLFVLLFITSLISLEAKPAKYVFLFIGDGMGLSHVTAADLYLKSVSGNSNSLNMLKLEGQGLLKTYSLNSTITDSAAAGTAMATGNKTNSNIISMDKTKKIELETIAEILKKNGKKIGIISSVSLDHATPAVFYAHNKSRSNYYDIALDMVDSGFDYFAGGGISGNNGFDDNNEKSIKRMLLQKNYKYIDTYKDTLELKPGQNKVVVISEKLEQDAFKYTIDMKNSNFNLDIYTKKGIELLDNEDGFFMMIEGGKIDWAAHHNDAATMIKEVLSFDKAIKEAINFYEKHKDETLIIVTADHSTGGLTIGHASTEYNTYLNLLENQKKSFQYLNSEFNEMYLKNKELTIKDLKTFIEKNTGLLVLSQDERRSLIRKSRKGDKIAEGKLNMNLNKYDLLDLELALKRSTKPDRNDKFRSTTYGDEEPFIYELLKILNNKAGLSWTTFAHTGEPVPVYSIGNGSKYFGKYLENTEIFDGIIKATELSE